MKQFELESDNVEKEAWEAFKKDGGFVTRNEGGFFDHYVGLLLYVNGDDFDDEDDVNDVGFNFFAGYQCKANEVNIPAEAFIEMFRGKLPKGMTIDWNDAESTHTVETVKPMTVGEAMKIIAPVLKANGFKGS